MCPGIQLSCSYGCFFFLAVAGLSRQLTVSRERHSMEVVLFVVSSVVALSFYMGECAHIGNTFLERNRYSQQKATSVFLDNTARMRT